ncbi:hypothetical protein DVS28_a0978 [Euzebya pacifica]|uniref:Uncharacterized protein n=1 Tax=Euzebya pacifica TaxID=1608957 RepID=A0A346XTY2_9ACTN|nr:hypothetical protein DVS28_a0978 [Euzebya pacifica]
MRHEDRKDLRGTLGAPDWIRARRRRRAQGLAVGRGGGGGGGHQRR